MKYCSFFIFHFSFFIFHFSFFIFHFSFFVFHFLVFVSDIPLQLAQRSDDKRYGDAEMADFEGTGDRSIFLVMSCFVPCWLILDWWFLLLDHSHFTIQWFTSLLFSFSFLFFHLTYWHSRITLWFSLSLDILLHPHSHPFFSPLPLWCDFSLMLRSALLILRNKAIVS